MSNHTVSRLRRALAHDGEDIEISELVETLALAVLGELPPDHAALFEGILDQYARAAEELGEDASIEDIKARADELDARPN